MGVMHIQNGRRGDYLDRQSVGVVIFSAMLTITVVGAIYIGFVAR